MAVDRLELSRHLDGLRGRRFAWGEFDCYIFVREWASKFGAELPRPDYRGIVGASRFSEACGSRNWTEALDRYLIPAPEPETGLIVSRGRALGIAESKSQGWFLTGSPLSPVNLGDLASEGKVWRLSNWRVS